MINVFLVIIFICFGLVAVELEVIYRALIRRVVSKIEVMEQTQEDLKHDLKKFENILRMYEDDLK